MALNVHRKTYTTGRDRAQAFGCAEWITQLDGAEGFHVAAFQPGDWDGREACAVIRIPDWLSFNFRTDNRYTLGFPLHPALLKANLRQLCDIAAAEGACLSINARTIEELEKAVRYVERRLPHYCRIALERINGGALMRGGLS
jgi:hypothetical protein